MCESHQSPGKDYHDEKHESCSCKTSLGITQPLLFLLVVVACVIPCARGESVELRLDNTRYRGATSSLLNNNPSGISILQTLPVVPREQDILRLSGAEDHFVPANLNDVLFAEDEVGYDYEAIQKRPDGRVNLYHEGGTEEDPLSTGEHDHDHSHTNRHLFWHVFGGAATLVAVGYIGTILPLWVSKMRPGLIDACNAFGAGGFWGLVFTHLFLEAIALCEEENVGIHFEESGTFFNGAYGFGLIGYLLLLWIEVILNSFARSRARKDQRAAAARAAEEHLVDIEPCTRGVNTGLPSSPYTAAALVDDHGEVVMVVDPTISQCPPGPHAHASISTIISIATALTVHAFLEGLIVGLRDEPSLIWLTVLSVCLHKWAVSLSISARLVGNVSKAWFWAVGSIFNFASGIAAICGYFIGSGDSVGGAVANALGVGVVIYVSQDITHSLFHGEDHHVIELEAEEKQEKHHHHHSTRSNLVLLVCLTLGAGVIFGASCLHFAHPGGHVH